MNPDKQEQAEVVEFVWRRLSEPCPEWAIGVPVLFAFLVVALIVLFKPERKLLTAIVGGAAVGLISIVYLPLAYFLVKAFSWMVILVPVVGVALFYVGMMYIRDARSVHWLWAIFLGLLRCSVYLILAVVFLLPGCQHKEEHKFESKVVVLFDVSGSMMTKDDLPEPGQNLDEMKTRQDKIYDWIMAKSPDKAGAPTPFYAHAVAKTPLTLYRFGQELDATAIHLHANPNKDMQSVFGQVLDEAEFKKLRDRKEDVAAVALRKWLNPDKKDYGEPNIKGLKEEDRKEKLSQWTDRLKLIDSLRLGTNIGNSCLQALKVENNSFVQAIIIVSDGQSNLGSDEARNEFLARVNNPKRTIPVITVGVGQFRLPVSIEVQDLQAPSKTRPDDKFPIRVPVVSSGIPGEKFTVTLEVSRVKDINGTEVNGETWVLDPKEGVFKGAGDRQQDIVEFEIDVEKLKGIKALDDKDGLLTGTWKFKAKTPRHAKESSDERHEKEVTVLVQKQPLRALLFAGGATREYQFLRTIFNREVHEERMELSIYLQNANEDHIAQDVAKHRMLNDFPDKLAPTPLVEPPQPPMSLGDYDVIIAFDPDWSMLTQSQQKNLQKWVSTHAGGIIFVAGPIYSFELARPGAYKVEEILKLYPVVPADSRLHGSTLPSGKIGHNASRPYALHFSPAVKAFDFMKLDESGDSPIAGWNGFFWNSENTSIAPGMDTQPRRGFFNYYPVERLKPDSQVVAAFAGPKEARIGGKSAAFIDQQPFIVSMRAGSGKSLYVGSGEFWRLRAYKDGFQERLWIKMARYVAAGATQQKKYGRIIMARKMPVGVLNFQVQLKGEDLQPLPQSERPTVHVERIDKKKPEKAEILKFDLEPKVSEDEWQGYFVGSIPMKEPGEYHFKVPVPLKDKPGEYVDEKLIVDSPDPENDNKRTNFGYLFQLASETSTLKRNLSAEQLREIERYVQVPADLPQGVSGSSKRLFFQVESADKVAKCLVTVQPKSETVKGRLEDLWDKGYDTGLAPVNAIVATVLAPLVIGLVGVIILLILRQWVAAALFSGICAVMSIAALASTMLIDKLNKFLDVPLDVSFSAVLMILVTLLGIEWLARKLLRLA